MKESNNSFDNNIQRYISGIYTKKDVDSLLDSVHSEADKRKLEEEMDKVWSDSPENELSINHQQYKKEAYQLLRRIKKEDKRYSFRAFFKYAAILLILVVTGIGVYKLSDRNIAEEVLFTEVYVRNAEHREIVLPDGTEVTLNAGSYMKYPTAFVAETRTIEMNGEAFFQVMENKEKPFIIWTKDASVKVLGTSFNVKAYDTDEQLLVSVETGKVQVDLHDAVLRLNPNEQVVFDRRNGEFQKRNEDTGRALVWLKGGLYFNRTPIHTVVSELIRIYDCKIEFDPSFEYDEHIYGEHDNMNLESVLKSIEYTTSIKYKKEGEIYTLYK